MRFQLFLILSAWTAVGAFGRRGAPPAQSGVDTSHFWDQCPYGWGLDLPVDPMSEAKAVEMIKEVKRGKIARDELSIGSYCVLLSDG
jgi:hypothetical protein